MKTKDIILGRKYSHVRFPKAVYLGTGRGKEAKNLVIIEDPEDNSMVGVIVQSPRYLRALNPKFWDGFMLTIHN